ncbi:MAG: hypothetical protein QG597_616, partial [Actinomycetota bacterium]|nr:hypothetical protein [Actinomycetota bacterium]
RLADIEARFGARVAGIVCGCSDSITENPDDKLPWRQRKETHLGHLATADDSVILVTAADKLHNARAIWTDIQRDGVQTLARFNAEPDRLAWYYESILEVLRDREAPAVLTIPLAEAVSGIAQSVS